MRYAIAVVLALAMVFAVSTASLASPFMSADEGQIELFGSYGYFVPFGVTAGLGYGFADGFTMGAMYSRLVINTPLFPVALNMFGAYANLTADPIVIKADVYFWPVVLGEAAGYFTFGVDPITLGLGGGVDFSPGYSSDFFIGGTAELAASDSLGIYGSVNYYPAYPMFGFEAGLSLSF